MINLTNIRERAESELASIRPLLPEWLVVQSKPAEVLALLNIIRDLERDAARYRWLREQHWNEAEMAVVCRPKESVKLGFECPSGERLDEAIDAQICGRKK